MGHLGNVRHTDVAGQLRVDGVDRLPRCGLEGGRTERRTLVVADRALVGGADAVRDVVLVRRRVDARGGDSLLEGAGEHEGLERRSRLPPAASAQAAECKVHLGRVEVAPAHQRLHETGVGLDRDERHVERRRGTRERAGDRLLGRGLHRGVDRRLDLQAATEDHRRPVLGDQVAAHVVDEVGELALVGLRRVHERGRLGRSPARREPQALAIGPRQLRERDQVLLEHLL